MAVRVWRDTQLQPPLQNLGTLFIKPARQIEQQVSLAVTGIIQRLTHPKHFPDSFHWIPQRW